MSYARMKISWPKGAVEATLEDTPTARALAAALPVKAKAQTWGRTPVSEGDESRLVTRCNVLGMIDGDPRRLASVRSGDDINVSLE